MNPSSRCSSTQFVERSPLAKRFDRMLHHGAPDLPLSSADCEKMIRGRSSKIALVGYFGRSWACANWETHPVFRDYACGLLACEHTPERIRADAALLKEFPPRPLEGLDKSLCWNAYERIFEFTQQLMRNEENWRRSGMADDAKWMRGVIEQLVGVKLDKPLRDFLDSQPPLVNR